LLLARISFVSERAASEWNKLKDDADRLNLVAQVSKPAVSQVSKPAGRRQTWKSAAQQVWKPALRKKGV
jgi:hypothetical protein